MTTILIHKNSDDDYTVRVFGGDLFMDVIRELKEIIPPYGRKYSPDIKAWHIRSDHFLHKWLGGVRDWDDVDIEWETARSDQHRAPPPPKPSRRDTAFATLHLLPTAPPELVRAAHKTLALIHHPDRGGDLERMKAINNAFDTLKVA